MQIILKSYNYLTIFSLLIDFMIMVIYFEDFDIMKNSTFISLKITVLCFINVLSYFQKSSFQGLCHSFILVNITAPLKTVQESITLQCSQLHYVSTKTKVLLHTYIQNWKIVINFHKAFLLMASFYIFGTMFYLDIFLELSFPLMISKQFFGQFSLLFAFLSSLQLIVTNYLVATFVYSVAHTIISIIILIKVFSSYIRDGLAEERDHLHEDEAKCSLIRQRLVFLAANHYQISRYKRICFYISLQTGFDLIDHHQCELKQKPDKILLIFFLLELCRF